MDAEKLNQELYDKMAAEQKEYRSWLLEQTPEEILNHVFEYSAREDILLEVSALALPEQQAAALLTSPAPLADIYKDFRNTETNQMEVVADCIKGRADTLLKAQQEAEAQQEKQEAVYLVDRASLLHLKEAQDGGFEYALFNRQTKEKTAEGRGSEDEVLDGIDPAHDHLAAARDAAIEAAGLDRIEVAQVGLTSLKPFPASDISRRSIWEPDMLPKDDIRFIDSGYNEQFRIPDGGVIQVEYPDRVSSAICEYIDDYHTYIGSEVYHMCQFAELLERGGAVCRPEPVMEADRAAWKIGWNANLAVKCGAGHWDYTLFDENFNVTQSGELEVVGLSINEVRDMILFENKLERRSITPTDYGMLMDKAAARQEQTGERPTPAQKPSIREQLAAAKAAQAEKPAAQQHQKNKEAR